MLRFEGAKASLEGVTAVDDRDDHRKERAVHSAPSYPRTVSARSLHG
jgi:hypothetical protein